MEVEQRIETDEHNLAFMGGYDGVLTLTDATKNVDGRRRGLDVDVDEFLETLDVRPLRPVIPMVSSCPSAA